MQIRERSSIAHRGRFQTGIGLPSIVGPYHAEMLLRDDQQRAARFYRLDRTAQLENFNFGTRMIPRIPPLYWWDAVEYLPVETRSQQLQVFGVGPDERHRGTCGFPEFHVLHSGPCPYLLGQHAA